MKNIFKKRASVLLPILVLTLTSCEIPFLKLPGVGDSDSSSLNSNETSTSSSTNQEVSSEMTSSNTHSSSDFLSSSSQETSSDVESSSSLESSSIGESSSSITEVEYTSLATLQQSSTILEDIHVKGRVIAMNATSFVLYDGTGKVCYFNGTDTPNVTLNDVVVIQGDSSLYGPSNVAVTFPREMKTQQFNATSASYEVIQDTFIPSWNETTIQWSESDLDAFNGTTGPYVSIRALIYKSGNFYNGYAVDGAKNTRIISLAYPTEAQLGNLDFTNATDLATALEVNLTGIAVYNTSYNPTTMDAKYVAIMLTEPLKKVETEVIPPTGKTTLDFYTVNDLHGSILAGSNPSIGQLTTYLKQAKQQNENSIFLSTGDMWQGSAESNLTRGGYMTDWMNALDFEAMAIGNHEYDWKNEYIQINAQNANFPMMGLNVYDKLTNTKVSYLQSSTLITQGGVDVGIIGAIGDCYSSISASAVSDVVFKVGDQLTSLVKAESNKLKEQGADVIVYLLHDGYGNSTNNTTSIASSAIASYYDVALSDGYVDISFEAHTHQSYVLKDSYGVYHLQSGGYNQGISHVQLEYDFASASYVIEKAENITSASYASLSEDPLQAELLTKYSEEINGIYDVLGNNASYRNKSTILNKCSELYLSSGLEKWGAEYDIFLGGGYLSCRSPYYLAAGDVTYAQLYNLLPFDNELVLCSISGVDLLKNFINTTNTNYYVSYSSYGSSLKDSVVASQTYYVITDTYSSDYSYNNLTVVDYYGGATYARDILADYIRNNYWA